MSGRTTCRPPTALRRSPPFSRGRNHNLDRSASGFQLRWLMLPAAWVLLASGLSLHERAYTGIALRPGGTIESVDVASPGALAQLQPGDRVMLADSARAADPLAPDALSGAAPGQPLVVIRERGGVRRPVWLAPRELPDQERRFNAVIFAVAAAFLLLGGWVWRERRDRLT